jgi:hypothetical protein
MNLLLFSNALGLPGRKEKLEKRNCIGRMDTATLTFGEPFCFPLQYMGTIIVVWDS